jgi:hypothetical protein
MESAILVLPDPDEVAFGIVRKHAVPYDIIFGKKQDNFENSRPRELFIIKIP